MNEWEARTKALNEEIQYFERVMYRFTMLVVAQRAIERSWPRSTSESSLDRRYWLWVKTIIQQMRVDLDALEVRCTSEGRGG